MRILITGSRNWTNESTIARAISRIIEVGGYYPPANGLSDVTLVHGGCRTGADAIADELGFDLTHTYGLQVERHPAKWRRFGKRAGYLRNAEMVRLGADVCLAFIRDHSRGATMTARLAQEAGIPTEIYRE